MIISDSQIKDAIYSIVGNKISSILSEIERFDISGRYDSKSIENCIYSDIACFARPHIYNALRIGNQRDSSSGSRKVKYLDSFIEKLVCVRLTMLMNFIGRCMPIMSEKIFIAPGNGKIECEFLAGDSHSGGRRPCLFRLNGNSYVLKFADPRTQHILNAAISVVEENLNFGLHFPEIVGQSSDQCWQVLPMLNGHQISNLTDFSSQIGAITAVAYFLEMTDIHLENLIISDGKPVIVDSECIFYNHDRVTKSVRDRLYSTGLVSEDISISAIRGGGDLSIFDIGNALEGGRLRYLNRAKSHKNRAIDDNGNLIDLSGSSKDVVKAFSSSLEVLVDNSDAISDLVSSKAYHDIRTRFLVRPTAHYKCAMEMLFSPIRGDRSSVMKKVLSRLVNLPSFADGMAVDADRCEISDMLNGDVPYFYCQGDLPFVFHEGNPISKADNCFTFKHRFFKALELMNPCRVHEAGKEFHLYLTSRSVGVKS
ncbi:DUF4135 domain-containing protein [Burkholderia cepacia]|uniref:DUF4135 domain-containing protein n=1 Tax=Burkholderia cepacia TaxID=292 RepID=UPI002AB5F7FC|nr:DUF4135 domain-containing protein [Burkholderia cepacia]